MKQLFLCHLITSLCYKSDLSVRLSCIFLFHLFHLFWRANQLNSENRRRFASKVGHFRYFMGLSCKVECFHGERRPSGLTKQPAVKEGRCSRYGSAIFAHFVCWELTHLFISSFFRSFRSSISLRKFIEH